MHIKICGITNLEDAKAAIDAGADLLGFNFYSRSSRYIKPEVAHQIIKELPSNIINVGVFVNEETPEDVIAIAERAGVGVVQLHGEESPDYCAQVNHEVEVIKAFRVGDRFKPEYVLAYETNYILLDAFSSTLYGGTGHTFNWSIAKETSRLVPKLFLAGGLTPDNIAQAISSVNPYGVDICSGVELSPGKKDHIRMQKFIETIKNYVS
jgi:phosphoribosylanthranilate isomerase